MATLHSGEESVSVAMEEVKAADWADKVYQPDILAKRDTLYKQPGYQPSLSSTVPLIGKPRRKHNERSRRCFGGIRKEDDSNGDANQAKRR